MVTLIFDIVFVTSLFFVGIHCQPPEWTSPTDNSNTELNPEADCSEYKNVVSGDKLSATSSKDTVYYRIVSQSPDHGAFNKGSSLSGEAIVNCEKEKVTASTYTIVLGAFYNEVSNDGGSTVTVTINVPSLNTNKKPVITKPTGNIVVKENVVVTDDPVLFTFEGTDEDGNADDLVFSMAKSEDKTKAKFKIVGKDLKFETAVTQDQIDADKDGAVLTYKLELEVSDGTDAVLKSTNIIIEDVNDEKPTFEGSFTANIAENSKEGDTVLVITAKDADKDTKYNTLVYAVYGTSPSVFKLEGNKILVASGATFDKQLAPTYTITISATDNGTPPLSQMQQFTVNVRTAPTFVDPDPDTSEDEHFIYICETLQKGDEIMVLQASGDSDVSTFTFSLDGTEEEVKKLFVIDGNKLKVASDVLQDFFDYEKENGDRSYDLTIKATDKFGLSTTLVTEVRIEDDNDNKPEFSGNFEASILDTSPKGTSVLKLTAKDNDVSEQFNKVSFTLNENNEFVIGGDDKDEIHVKDGATFDFKTTSSFKVTVTATDNDPEDPLTNTQEITINIITAPTFVDPDPDTSKDEHFIYICETLQKGDEIIVLQASGDSDVSTFTFSLDGTEEEVKKLFVIDGNKLKVASDVLQDFFDYEKENGDRSYDLTIKATDKFGLSTTLVTEVRIEDDNDNKPEFSGNFEASILDTSPKGTSVLKLTANDNDVSEQFNKVSFTLNENNEFVIGGDDKDEIHVKDGATFDFKTTSSYKVTVTATDNDPEDPLTNTQEIIINIITAPTFVDPDPDTSKDEHFIYICETLQKGDEIIVLQASGDSDVSTFTFSLDGTEEEVKKLFVIDGNKLKVASDVLQDFFDYEKENRDRSYDLTIKATDKFGLSTTLVTEVRIEDDNDNKPEFSGNFEASILDTSPKGTSVLKLTAKDQDVSEQFNKVSFTINENDEFAIGGDDKDEIHVKDGATFDFKTTSSYKVTVTATDNDPEDPMTNTQEITINIITELVFNKLKTEQSVSVLDGSDSNVVIYTLDVTDTDEKSTLILSIAEQPAGNTFRLDGKDLKMKIGETIEGDTGTTSYKLKFEADNGTNKVTSEFLTVTITEVNDNPPVIADLNPTVEISEKMQTGEVYTVKATDADKGNSKNEFIFSKSETGTDHFTIGANDGIIKVKSGTTLSFNDKQEYEVVVTVKDDSSDSKAKSASTTVTVELLTAPTFIKPTNDETISVDENSPDGTDVVTLEVKDDDGDTPKLTLVSQDPVSPEMFVLDGKKLKTKGTFDVDVKDPVMLYTLKLKVSDQNDKTDDQTIEVKISITDSNSHNPVFKAGETYEADVKETDEIGFLALTVTATDEDLTKQNNKITYSITGSDFEIDGSNGKITVAKKLAYSSTQAYSLTVTATDGGGKSAAHVVKFTILAEPSFDNFDSPKTIDIKENEPSGTTVITLTVSDEDNTWDNKIIINSSPANIFKMDGFIVKTNTNDLDAEKDSKYEVTFSVIDGDFTVKSEKLTVNILDLNDNDPVITQVADITMQENAQINDVVLEKIEAKDDDISEKNNQLSYAITSGNDDDTFKIDPTSGKIQLNSQLKEETYTLQITVSDNGEPVRSATTEIKVIVNASTVNECNTSPCENEGTCVPSLNKYTCNCVPGYIGDNCETNRDECTPDPCVNGGTCKDGINLYTCDCEKGWGGQTCSDACVNNKYGKNCAQSCNCNATRLLANVGTQQCDIKEGACKCNDKYSGPTCEDIDECKDGNICGNQPNVVCINRNGGHDCVCKQFYKKVSNVCTRAEEDKTVVLVGRERKIVVLLSIDVNCLPLGLDKPPNYEKVKVDIMRTQCGSRFVKRCFVFNIRCGSLKYELVIVADEENVPQVSKELAEKSNNMIYDGNSVAVNEITVNGEDIKALTSDPEQTCAAYTAIAKCSDGYKCVIENGLPACRKEEDDKDNLKLILGLGLGVCLPLLLLAMIAAACLYGQLMKSKNQEKRGSQGYKTDSLRESPWHGRMKQNGYRMDTRNYNGYGYDTDRYFDNFYNKKSVYDMPGRSYTNI